MRLNRYRLRHLSRSGNRGAHLSERLLQRPDRLLGIILLGNNFLNILASAIATLLALHLGGDHAVAIATGVLTFAILIFAEVAPKTLAALKPEPVAFFAAYIFTPLLKVLYPLIWLLNLIANGLLLVFGLRANQPSEDGITREELRTLVLESGNLLARRQEMLLGVLELEEASVEDVMVPRSRISGIDIEDEWDDILAQIRTAEHTRLPLFRESIDDIIGVLHLRDLATAMPEGKLDLDKLRALAREPYFVPEGTSLARQLVNFQRQGTRFALVVDEYGDILGLVTVEDVLRDIVGGLGNNILGASTEIIEESDGSVLVPGFLAVRTLNRLRGWHLPTNGPRTINGLVLESLETIPKTGTRFNLAGHRAEIVETSASGVLRVRFLSSKRAPQSHESTSQ